MSEENKNIEKVKSAPKPKAKVKKPSSWTRLNGKRVGVGGDSWIMKAGKKVHIPAATAEEMKQIEARGAGKK